VIGAALGLAGVGTPAALVGLAVALAAKIVVDVTWQRLPVVGWPTAYAVYCYNLAQRGELTEHAWLSYVLQLLGFGLVVGWAAYALLKYFT
jgi:ABC-type nitrate/sulfonate/bicarbonate transport system permease component